MSPLWNVAEPLVTLVMTRLPATLAALGALLVGWMIARLIGAGVQRLVYRLTHNQRLRELVEISDEYRLDKIAGKLVYYLLMVFVLVLFFDILGVSAVMGPFVAMAGEFTAAIPHLVQAGLIFLVAWMLGTLLRGITVRLLNSAPMRAFMGRVGVAEDDAGRARLVSTGGNLVYYLVLLVFLPAILSALQLEGMGRPFEQMLTQLLSFLPNLLAAAVTLLVGYLAARVARGIVTHFLASAGVDALPAKVGLAQVFKATPLSRMAGTVVYVLILLPVVISALETLGLEAISAPAISMLTVVLNMVPAVIIALALLAAGIAMGRWVGQVTASLVTNTNLPQFLHKWGLTRNVEEGSRVPAFIGNIVSGVIVLLVAAEALEILQLSLLSSMLREILEFLPNVAVAVIILAVGWGVGAFANTSLRSLLAQTPYPVWLGTVAKTAILTVAAMMAFEQLGVAQSIVVNAFSIFLGSLGLAAALALGLGSRDLVEQWMARFSPPQGGQQNQTQQPR